MTMIVLTECVQDWANSILNNLKFPDWYHSLASKTWPKALQSAIGFLAGHFPGILNIIYLVTNIYR